MIWIYISELLLYLSFSIIVGTLIIQLVPVNLKPNMQLNKRVLQVAIFGILLFSMAPVIRLVLFIYEDYGFFHSLMYVIGGFEVGKAWALTAIIAFFFFLFVSFLPVLQNRKATYVSFVFAIALVVVFGWASHSTTIASWGGFTFHTIHFAAVITWVGVLFVVSFFATNTRNWLPFLSWFSSLATICVLYIVGSGIFLMQFVLNYSDYTNSWMIPYGQALLIKHLIFIPILLFAFINGVLVKKMLELKKDINPLPWVKFESLTLLLIFAATAVLGQQEPPLGIENTLKNSGPSTLFDYFYIGTIDPAMSVQFELGTMSILLFVLSALFAFIMLYAFKTKAHAGMSFFMGILCALAIYLGLMTGIQ